MMRLTILALLFTLSAAASSPEYLVGGTVPTAATRLRFQPAVASDGTDYFAVWTDDRSGSGSVMGTRIARDGRVLDPLGIRIAAETASVSSASGAEPQVAWDGAAYLVAWSAERPSNIYDRNVYAARIAPDGRMVMQPRLIAEGGSTDSGRYVASNGTVSVIAYQDSATGHLRIAVLDRDGDTLHHETIFESPDYGSAPAVAAGTTRFVVAWNTNPGFSAADEKIMAVSLTAAGHVTGTPMTVGRGEHPAIGTDGTRFTIASYFNLDWQTFHLVSRTFDGSLTPVGPERELLSGRQLRHATVLWTGSHYEVFSAREVSGGINEIVSVELDRDGNPQQPLRARGSAWGFLFWLRLAVATNGTDVLLVRSIESAPPVGTQMFAQVYPGNATSASAPALLSWSGNAHREPSIAASAAGHFAAWIEDDGAYATRIDAAGNSLDGRGIRLSAFPWSFVRAAFDGTNYVVAWRDATFIGVRFIAPHDGATVAEVQIPASDYPELALASSPDATYLAYARDRVRVVRIPHATHTPDPVPLAVSPEEMVTNHPALSWNGSTLLVVWAQQYTVPRADPPLTLSVQIHAARVTPSLTLLDPSPLLIATTGEEDEEYSSYDPPSVASNGADWLVVTGLNGSDVVARRVLQGGTVAGNAPEKIGEGMYAVAAWDGSRYAVAWKEGEYGDPERPLVLAVVPAHGALEATNRVLVASRTVTGFSQGRPSIASTGNGQAVVAYTRISNRPEHAGVERTFFRVMDFNKRGRVIRR